MRYEDVIPWRVRVEHAKHYDARMLRLLGRRRSNIDLDAGESQRLNSWLSKLTKENAVVGYCRDHPEGFLWVDASHQSPADCKEGIPIRRIEIQPDEIL
jgi:hypothetical protein